MRSKLGGYSAALRTVRWLLRPLSVPRASACGGGDTSVVAARRRRVGVLSSAGQLVRQAPVLEPRPSCVARRGGDGLHQAVVDAIANLEAAPAAGATRPRHGSGLWPVESKVHRVGPSGRRRQGQIREAKSIGALGAAYSSVERAPNEPTKSSMFCAPTPTSAAETQQTTSRTKVHVVAHTRTPHSPLLRRDMQLGHSHVPAPSGCAVLAWAGRAVYLCDEHVAPPGRHPAQNPCSSAGGFTIVPIKGSE